MATTRVIDVVEQVEQMLIDTDGTRWPRLGLQDSLNAAYAVIVLLKPDANTGTAAFACAAGVLQDLQPSTARAVRLLNVLNNVSGDKRAVTRVDRSLLDAIDPNWRSQAAAVVEHFIPDDDTPTQFEVFPPAAAGHELLVSFVQIPEPHALTETELNPANAHAETIRLNDTYQQILVDYVMYRALLRDSDEEPLSVRASMHLNAFAQALGASTSAVEAVSPQTTEPAA